VQWQKGKLLRCSRSRRAASPAPSRTGRVSRCTRCQASFSAVLTAACTPDGVRADANLRHHRVVTWRRGRAGLLGAYLSYQLFTSFGIDPFLAIRITTVDHVRDRRRRAAGFPSTTAPGRPNALSVLVKNVRRVALLLEGVMTVVWSTRTAASTPATRTPSGRAGLPDHAGAGSGRFLLSLAAGMLHCAQRPGSAGPCGPASNPESARLLRRRVRADRRDRLRTRRRTAAAAGSSTACCTRSTPAATTTISQLLFDRRAVGLGASAGVRRVLIISVPRRSSRRPSPIWSPMTFFVVCCWCCGPPRGLFGTTVRGDMRQVHCAPPCSSWARRVARFGLAHWLLTMLVFTLMFAVCRARESARRLRRLPVARARGVLGIGAYALSVVPASRHHHRYEPFLCCR